MCEVVDFCGRIPDPACLGVSRRQQIYRLLPGPRASGSSNGPDQSVCELYSGYSCVNLSRQHSSRFLPQESSRHADRMMKARRRQSSYHRPLRHRLRRQAPHLNPVRQGLPPGIPVSRGGSRSGPGPDHNMTAARTSLSTATNCLDYLKATTLSPATM